MKIQLHGQDEVEAHSEQDIAKVFKTTIEKSGHWCYHCGSVKVEEGISLCKKCGEILSGRC